MRLNGDQILNPLYFLDFPGIGFPSNIMCRFQLQKCHTVALNKTGKLLKVISVKFQ